MTVNMFAIFIPEGKSLEYELHFSLLPTSSPQHEDVNSPATVFILKSKPTASEKKAHHFYCLVLFRIAQRGTCIFFRSWLAHFSPLIALLHVNCPRWPSSARRSRREWPGLLCQGSHLKSPKTFHRNN